MLFRSGCVNLTNVTIPPSVMNIEDEAFSDCPQLTIYGYGDSEAERYALANSIPFVTLSKADPILGDINVDGSINAQDALMALQHSVGLVRLESFDTADVDCNGQVNASDALLILQKSVGLIIDFPMAK